MESQIETKIKISGLFTHVSTAIGLAGGLITLYQLFGAEDNVPLVWGLTVTFFTCIFFMLLNYCFFAQNVLRDEVRRCALAKSKLESTILKKRKSSKRKES